MGQLVYQRPLPLSVRGCVSCRPNSQDLSSSSPPAKHMHQPWVLCCWQLCQMTWIEHGSSSSTPQSLWKQQRPLPPQSKSFIIPFLTRGQLVGQVSFDDSAGSIFPSQCTVSGMSGEKRLWFLRLGLTMTSMSLSDRFLVECNFWRIVSQVLCSGRQDIDWISVTSFNSIQCRS